MSEKELKKLKNKQRRAQKKQQIEKEKKGNIFIQSFWNSFFQIPYVDNPKLDHVYLMELINNRLNSINKF